MSTVIREKRTDGRKFDEMRPVAFKVDYLDGPDGCVLVELGRTVVLCAASLEPHQPPHLKGTDQGWVTAEYEMLPRANPLKRALRESVTGRRKGRTHEIERMIGRCLRAVVDLKKLGSRTIYIDCDVLQADGGTRTASITGGFLALARAVDKATSAGDIGPGAIKHYLAAVSVGIVQGHSLLDLTYEEDSGALVDMNTAWTSEGKLVEVQAMGEEHTFSRDELDRLMDLSRSGAEKLIAMQKQLVPLRP